MAKLRPLVVIGTRPEAIKLAPVVHACQRRPAEIEPVVCLTGQHRELLSDVVEYFALPVQRNLDVMTPRQSLAELTARCVSGLEIVLQETRPDCVVLQGDTTSAMAASLAAFYRGVPIVHVEAGLRTGNLHAPWPEELNRRVISLATSLHCAPTKWAADNLRAEGVLADSIHVTGNTVVDALQWSLQREQANDRHWRQRHSALADQTVVLVTAHRRENFGGPLERIFQAVARLAEQFADVAFVFPVHLNPQVQTLARSTLANRQNVHLLEPLPYGEFVWMMARCRLILSDSGGIQEEAPSLRKPVVVLRDTTERPEALEANAVLLVGSDVERIVSVTGRLLRDAAFYAAHQAKHNPYGDGRAAERVVELMIKHIGNAKRGNDRGIRIEAGVRAAM